MPNELLTQFTWASVVVYGLQYLKASSWFPWLTTRTKGLNRLAAIAGASLTAVGIAWHYDPVGTLTITGVTAANLLHGVWHIAQQVAMQQVIFDGTAQAVAAKGTPTP